MARLKGSKNKAEKPVQVEQEAVYRNEPAEQVAEVKGAVCGHSKWIYHEDEEPRILKAGDTMPKGWQDHRNFDGVAWEHDRFGVWTRVTKGETE